MKFTAAEKRFLNRNDVCRIATSYNDAPYLSPVTYVFDGFSGFFYFCTDYTSKKYRNLKNNKRLVIEVDDTYRSSLHNRAIVVFAEVDQFIDRGPIFRNLYSLFYKKFAWVKEDPFQEGEAPFVKVRPVSKVSWGLE